ncbi:hypothetical protein C2G38_2169141 [Gigaspora rosea]|uniref:Uncharacterized protein n=1 Tax=Gigaspora rosea TaxID=44941 RepID=A0A397VP06_9GLOM|nr:hypothetical protein C2G38_2169141 [Gigaspora rosea]
MEQLCVAQNRMNNIVLSSDISRIPSKIAIGEDGFSKQTADQWKTFIMIYATTILWDMLNVSGRKILGHFVRACNLLVSRIVNKDELKEAYERLKDMARIIESTYGPEFITSNIHLALIFLIAVGIMRLNGYIGSYPNSNRQIEPELMKIFLKNALVDYHLTRNWTPGLLDNTLHLIKPKKAVGSLALTSTIDNKELKYFLSHRHQISVAFKIYGTEPIPGRMLSPSYMGVIMPLELKKILYEWYKILYKGKYKNIEEFMYPVINQHTKLQIGDEIFGSMISSYKNNSIILAKWKAKEDKTSDIYLGEVQYYFEHTLRLPQGPKTQLLAYIRWYKCASSSATQFKYSFMNSKVSNTEIWKTEHYKEGYDSILPVHRILCRAIKIKYHVGNSENYISIVPLNRRFNF